MRLLATSDLHLSHRINREALSTLGSYPDDWLIVAGDVGESPDHLALALGELTPRFRQVLWTPGNHELWSRRHAPDARHGVARYDELVAVCLEFGAISPEDPYPRWPPDPDTYVVPMFLLYDYSYRPAEVPAEGAVAWARESGVVCGDEFMLDPRPFASRQAWCHERVATTAARLDALPREARTVLVNHWPLRADLARPPRVPRFSIWCGTTLTEDWARRYRARAVVSGHLHLRTTLWRHGVRYEEVSLGYPRDWRHDRGLAYYLREILPGTGADAQRFVPARDPFHRV
ncbi:MAG TPA: metallophosphoesterase [Vicinamibacterales bacterium]|nr:metallophosphoesterase [Vicinamibacterales bacterium]